MVFLSFSPGPNNILCSVNGTKYGWKKTLPLISGTITGFFLVGLFTSVSVEIIKEQQDLLDNMKYICGFYLIYLSYLIATDDPEKYKALANLPTREELISKFASMLNQPMSNLASVLNATMNKLAGTLKSMEEQKQ